LEQDTISQAITALILRHIEESGLSDRKWAESVGISHPMIGRFKDGTAMGIDTLERIVTKYPELRQKVAAVFYQTEEKSTAATNSTEAAILREAMAELREQLAFLRAQNSDLTKALLQGKVVEQSQ
jgi:predicted XRE-type DNA-binding protein